MGGKGQSGGVLVNKIRKMLGDGPSGRPKGHTRPVKTCCRSACPKIVRLWRSLAIKQSLQQAIFLRGLLAFLATQHLNYGDNACPFERGKDRSNDLRLGERASVAFNARSRLAPFTSPEI